MILIYSDYSSLRLQYICKFIFNEQLGITHSITIDPEGFHNHDGPKINYSKQTIDNAFNIQNHTLLSESIIKEQDISCFELNQFKAFFKNQQSDFPFDIFAASFYLLSRYEEYLSHELDKYGRYAHEQSLAYREGFLDQPIVNIWLQYFSRSLKERFPAINIKFPAFKFIPTYDIDIAYSYKNKGPLRNLGGFIKKPTLERLAVISGMKKDPFDSYDFMDGLHDTCQLSPIYFFLVATAASLYDKNISPFSPAMCQLIKRHSKKYMTGLHPSWRSQKNFTILSNEKIVLETASEIPITRSRQHYIRFSLPDTFEQLVMAGIEMDYSMGYGSINGFRASVASPFYWYDLKNEKITSLQLYPFCFMDANSYYEQGYSTEEAYQEMLHYYHTCKNVHGLFISVFHNNFLGTDKQFRGWKEVYIRFISQLQQ